jgi:hypothetical protein
MPQNLLYTNYENALASHPFRKEREKDGAPSEFTSGQKRLVLLLCEQNQPFQQCRRRPPYFASGAAAAGSLAVLAGCSPEITGAAFTSPDAASFRLMP